MLIFIFLIKTDQLVSCFSQCMQGCQVAVESMQAERRASFVLAQCAQYAERVEAILNVNVDVDGG